MNGVKIYKLFHLKKLRYVQLKSVQLTKFVLRRRRPGILNCNSKHIWRCNEIYTKMIPFLKRKIIFHQPIILFLSQNHNYACFSPHKITLSLLLSSDNQCFNFLSYMRQITRSEHQSDYQNYFFLKTPNSTLLFSLKHCMC